jgi:ubiquinone/menaquinone biosynthesis C-methylase UbiE
MGGGVSAERSWGPPSPGQRVLSVMHDATPEQRLNYDEIAATYDRRFTVGGRAEVAATLVALARDLRPERILEVGCGTGHWLAILHGLAGSVYGLDRSAGMLAKARDRAASFGLVRGHANRLPLTNHAFDLVLCVSALHHFDDPQGFVGDARLLLRPGGALTIIGMNPHAGRDRWYLYEYFPGTLEADRRRYPSSGTIMDWMIAAGFDAVEWRVAARIVDTRVGKQVWDDPMLHKHATSQLAVLSDDAYAAGIARIEAALAEATAAGREMSFPVNISLAMVTGRAQGGCDVNTV